MDTAHWPPQELGLVKPMGELLGASTLPTTTTTSTVMINNHNDNNMLTRPPAAAAAPQVMERRARPQKEQALNCPRCNSTNTKFCYYNNYSLTQPRYFCKTCRRYWTEGGSLRNVPVGGGSRKNKRSSNSSASISTTSTATAATSSSSTLSNISHSSKKLVASSVVASHDLTPDQDLNLSFAATTTTNTDNNSNTNCSSAMDLLRGRGLGPFMPMPDAGRVYPAGFGLHHHEFRAPTASGFSMDGDQISGGGRLLFPFEEARQVSASSATNGHHHHHHHHHQFDQEQSRGQGMDPSPGFWNGMIGGGGPW